MSEAFDQVFVETRYFESFTEPPPARRKSVSGPEATRPPPAAEPCGGPAGSLQESGTICADAAPAARRTMTSGVKRERDGMLGLRVGMSGPLHGPPADS